MLDITTLYVTEYERLRSFVRRMVRNPDTAEDLVQQVFANILGSGGSSSPHNAAYVRRAVRNLALNYLRDSGRHSQVEMVCAATDDIADTKPSPEMVVLYRSELRRLLMAIAQLPPRRRQAFVLNRIEGLSYDEIARHMDISRNTVITQVVAAMAELDRRLGAE
ncbi:RNA polymerase sigma factor [Agrobacterium sp. V1]|uniref:RNA polymerase sigma factor n=1 Tax=Agrobacterium sp. V1 TaxID=3061957 RepID=UPI002673C863|nr:sigma-70 family RNA polymerase sigma factor [Agrobacterium sp. V1]MDO3445470.1 sigma-70 family RNA polymerase sigma factor [Agrobacterium sp. V1]